MDCTKRVPEFKKSEGALMGVSELGKFTQVGHA